jgi:hypothetical protein
MQVVRGKSIFSFTQTKYPSFGFSLKISLAILYFSKASGEVKTSTPFTLQNLQNFMVYLPKIKFF